MSNLPGSTPKSLNEWTLELNIGHEICNLIDSFFPVIFNEELYELFFPRLFSLSPHNANKCKLYKLSPIEENKHGGWDIKIKNPNITSNSNAMFIQLKSGKHSNGVRNNPRSVFSVNKKRPNKHAFFKLNDNKGNNQHKVLSNFSSKLANKKKNKSSVLYGFPRVTSLDRFDKLNEDLLLHTTFLTIDEMNAEADKNNISLSDNKKHHFRTCYVDLNRMEISSETFPITNSNTTNQFILELLKVKFLRHKIWMEDEYNFYNFIFLLQVALYLKIPKLEFFEDYFSFSPFFRGLKKALTRNHEEWTSNIGNIYDNSEIVIKMLDQRNFLFDELRKFIKSAGKENIESLRRESSNFSISLEPEEVLSFEFDKNSTIFPNMYIF